MASELTTEQKNLLNKVTKSNRIENYNVRTNTSTIKGDGYLGIITSIQIQDKNNNKKLHLIMKSAQKGAELRKQAPIKQAYEREIFLYDKVLQEFKNLQVELNVEKPFKGFAKCYITSLEEENECLILENLREIGYKLWDRKKAMDPAHVGEVFKEYGKFHALSFALKKFKPKVFDNFTDNLGNIFKNSVDSQALLQSSIDNFQKAMNSVEDHPEAIKALKRFGATSKEFFTKIVEQKDRFTVINHGDCWSNNMMFKYENSSSTTPSHVCFLDWQLARYGSPVLDLSYFFYSCSSKPVLDNLNTYLKIYHDSLSAMLSQMDLDSKDLFTFHDLRTQWRIYSKYGFYMSIVALKVMLSDSREAPDLEVAAGKGQNFLLALDIHSPRIMEEYNRRLRNIILSMTKSQLIF